MVFKWFTPFMWRSTEVMVFECFASNFFTWAAPMSNGEVAHTKYASVGNKTPLAQLINDAGFCNLIYF